MKIQWTEDYGYRPEREPDDPGPVEQAMEKVAGEKQPSKRSRWRDFFILWFMLGGAFLIGLLQGHSAHADDQERITELEKQIEEFERRLAECGR